MTRVWPRSAMLGTVLFTAAVAMPTGAQTRSTARVERATSTRPSAVAASTDRIGSRLTTRVEARIQNRLGSVVAPANVGSRSIDAAASTLRRTRPR